MGVAPTAYEPKVVTIALNKDFSSVINFKNPFRDSILVKIYLEFPLGDDNKDIIKLLGKYTNNDKNT